MLDKTCNMDDNKGIGIITDAKFIELLARYSRIQCLILEANQYLLPKPERASGASKAGTKSNERRKRL